MVEKYWLGWADAFIEDVDDEVPENFTMEYRTKIAEWLKKMAIEYSDSKRD